MSSLKHRPNGLRRARVEYTLVDGQLRGTVVLQGGSELPFENTAELERCLGVGSRRLVLVEDGTARSDDHGLAALSPTELSIARAALAGASNREIADALFYSVKSVEAYLTRVYRRLGIEGRSGLQAVSGVLEDLEPLPEQADLVAGGAAAGTGTGVVIGPSAIVELLLV